MPPSQLQSGLRSALILAGLLGVHHCATAVTLGDADLRSFRGQALEVRIPLRVERNEYVGLECFKVRAAQGTSAPLQPLVSGRFRLEEALDSATLLVRSYESFNTADAVVEIVARCPDAKGEVTRLYRLELPALDPAAQVSESAPAMVIIQRPGEAPVVQPLGASGASSPTAASRGARTWRVGKGESLDSIARGIYPKSAKLRSAFISRLRSANAQTLPPDKDPLPEGLVLNWPDLVALANASPRIDTAATQPGTAAQGEPRPAAQRPTAREAAPAPATVTTGRAAPAAPGAAVPQQGRMPAKPASAPETRPGTPAKSRSEAGFTLRLSGADLDLSRSKGVSEGTRAALREKQLLLDADDQVAALLSLRNTVKQLEGRLNEMQLKLATLPPSGTVTETRPPAKTASASTPAPLTTKTDAPPAQNPSAAAAPAKPATDAPKPPETSQPPAAPQPAPAAPAAPKAAEKKAGPTADAPTEEAGGSWWTSPYLAGGLLVLLLLTGLAIWARRKPAATLQSEYSVPSSGGPYAAGPRSSGSHERQPQAENRDSVADEFADDLDQRFAESAPAAAGQSGRSATDAAGADPDGPRSTFRPQDTLRIHAPVTQATEDEFFSTSLELDTRPATAIDFVLGEDAGEDKSRRQRYMEERFPELASRSISVDDPDSIIDAARHHYEEGELQRASELLTYAFEERPGQLRFWLALFEIYRLEQRAEDFLELATRFKNVHGGTDAWPKVQHIGRDLDSSQALYAAALGRLGVPLDSDFDPVSENWLNVPMDFTSDVLMIELRQALLAEHSVDATRLSRPLLEVS